MNADDDRVVVPGRVVVNGRDHGFRLSAGQPGGFSTRHPRRRCVAGAFSVAELLANRLPVGVSDVIVFCELLELSSGQQALLG